MIDITNKEYKPDIAEIDDFIGNPLFRKLCEYIESEYAALYEITYSRDSVLPGWNIRFYKSGRTLCRVYPKSGFFSVLLVVGRKERERVEAMLPSMSERMQKIYHGTVEGMGQRWLVFDLNKRDALYEDFLTIVKIRRN